MSQFEETRRIVCRNDAGKSIVLIEQRKWPRFASPGGDVAPILDYMTEDGEVASKLDDGQFLLLLSDEVFLAA